MSTPFEPGDQMDRDRIICPYCGENRRADPCDGDGGEEPEDEHCDECGKDFIRYASIDITYHTQPKREKP